MDSTATGISIPYCGAAPAPAQLMGDWNLDPVLILALLVAPIMGLCGAERRGAFLLGWGALVLAFVSPLCASTTALFTARTLHHLLLVSLAAPALAMGWRLRGPSAPISLGLTALGLVAWHVPAIYNAAWDSATIYWLMQAALILPAWRFWSAVLTPAGRDVETLGLDALMIGALAGVMGMIGAVLTFAGHVLYPQHLAGAALWGIDPLADQQMAGLVMWVPGLIPLAALAAIMGRRAWQQGLAA